MRQLSSVLVLLIGAVIFSPSPACSVSSGEAAPAFELSDLQGRRHMLSDYQGKAVLINFWASWCKECITEMPSLNSLYEQFSRQGLAVLGVTVDRSAEEAGAAAKKAGITFPVLLDTKGEVFIKKYAAMGLPTTIMIDRKGVVRDIFVGTQDFQDKEIKDKVGALVKEHHTR
ncbi:MAG: redoxin domain-containing protein [Nitrospirae bacterium]|nr:redoxin domain-containing protein [Nitrospirota bacterium]